MKRLIALFLGVFCLTGVIGCNDNGGSQSKKEPDPEPCADGNHVGPSGIGKWYSDANGHYMICAGCGARLNEAPHDFDEWVVTQEASCYNEGEKYRLCRVCNYKEEAHIDIEHHSDGHFYYNSETGEHFLQCTGCGKEYNKHTADFGEPVYTTEPTCTEPGEYYRTCSVCNGSTYFYAKELGHDWCDELIIDKEPTLTEPGKGHYECSRCDVTMTANIPVISAHFLIGYDSDSNVHVYLIDEELNFYKNVDYKGFHLSEEGYIEAEHMLVSLPGEIYISTSSDNDSFNYRYNATFYIENNIVIRSGLFVANIDGENHLMYADGYGVIEKNCELSYWYDFGGFDAEFEIDENGFAKETSGEITHIRVKGKWMYVCGYELYLDLTLKVQVISDNGINKVPLLDATVTVKTEGYEESKTTDWSDGIVLFEHVPYDCYVEISASKSGYASYGSQEYIEFVSTLVVTKVVTLTPLG